MSESRTVTMKILRKIWKYIEVHGNISKNTKVKESEWKYN